MFCFCDRFWNSQPDTVNVHHFITYKSLLEYKSPCHCGCFHPHVSIDQHKTRKNKWKTQTRSENGKLNFVVACGKQVVDIISRVFWRGANRPCSRPVDWTRDSLINAVCTVHIIYQVTQVNIATFVRVMCILCTVHVLDFRFDSVARVRCPLQGQWTALTAESAGRSNWEIFKTARDVSLLHICL